MMCWAAREQSHTLACGNPRARTRARAPNVKMDRITAPVDRTEDRLPRPTVSEESRQLVHLSAEEVAAQRGGQRLVSHLWTAVDM